MKKLYILTLFLTSIAVYGQGTVALHHNGNVQMFRSSSAFYNAYDASVSGDTIYLPGGYFDGFTINKKLTIIGAGHHPDSTLATYPTQINGSINLSSSADSLHIEGLYITGDLKISSTNLKVDYLKIKRNIIDGIFSINGNRTTPSLHLYLAENVIRGSVDLSNTLQAVVTNNIFQTRIHYINQGAILNNVFLTNPYIGYPFSIYCSVYDCDYSTIRNNVFVNPDGASFGFAYCDNSAIENNLIVHSSVSYINSFPSGNYIGVSSSSILVNWTSNSFLYTDNYHLQSPATYLGTDGTQVGIYGGSSPVKQGYLPLNPHIITKTVAPNTDSNGNLNINFKVKAQTN